MLDGKTEGSGKAINLGRKWGAEVKPKGDPEIHYPTLYIDKLSADSPLAKKAIDADFTAVVQLRMKGIRKSREGVSIDLEARNLTI